MIRLAELTGKWLCVIMPLISRSNNSIQHWGAGRGFMRLTYRFLWTPAQRKRASMLYFANVYLFIFFMAALFSGPG